MTHTCQTQFHLERCQRADTFGRARRWGCGAVYEPALIPYRAQNIAHPTREESEAVSACGYRPPHSDERSCRNFRRRFLWTPSVCSDSCAVKTGISARRVAMCPSLRRWKRSKRASVRGTGVRLRECASRALKQVSVPDPLARAVSYTHLTLPTKA